MASIVPNQTAFVPATILPVTVPVPATLPVPRPTTLGQDAFVSSVAPSPVAAPTPAKTAAPASGGLFDRLHQLMQQLTAGAAPAPAQTPPAPAPKPAPKAEPKPEPAPAAAPTYTVQSGDSLSAIAQKTLGNANRWHEVFDLNRDQISNPDLIQPGQVLKLPGGSAPTPAPAPATGGTYTVQPGDSLSSIAQGTLGDANRWHEIYDLNRDTISNPDVISAGQVLTLPGGAQAPAPAPAPAASGGPITDRSRIYLHQPNGWTCGPTSLTMAAAAFGLRPSNIGTVDELVRRSRCNPNDGIPDSNAIPDAARQIGMNATHLSSSSPGDVRAALERGHGVVYNGSLGSGGHFIYVAGLNPDGSFIICDPWRPDVTRMNDQQLNGFGHTNGHSGSMVEVWK